MKEGAPLRTTGHRHLAFNNGLGRQKVHYQVEAGAAREPVDGAEAKGNHGKRATAHRAEQPLAGHLATGVQRNRLEVGPLVEDAVAGSVNGAATGEDKS